MIITNGLVALIYVAYCCVSTALLLVFISYCEKKRNIVLFIIGVFIIGCSIMIGLLALLSFIPPLHETQYTGEIIKFYANGTALLDNGTFVQLSSIPGMGCP